jgi:hypothetical protein
VPINRRTGPLGEISSVAGPGFRGGFAGPGFRAAAFHRGFGHRRFGCGFAPFFAGAVLYPWAYDYDYVCWGYTPWWPGYGYRCAAWDGPVYGWGGYGY